MYVFRCFIWFWLQPTVTDSQGNLNNVVRVKKSDFQIIEALEDDGDAVKRKSQANKPEGKMLRYHWYANILSGFSMDIENSQPYKIIIKHRCAH